MEKMDSFHLYGMKLPSLGCDKVVLFSILGNMGSGTEGFESIMEHPSKCLFGLTIFYPVPPSLFSLTNNVLNETFSGCAISIAGNCFSYYCFMDT